MNDVVIISNHFCSKPLIAVLVQKKDTLTSYLDTTWVAAAQ